MTGLNFFKNSQKKPPDLNFPIQSSGSFMVGQPEVIFVLPVPTNEKKQKVFGSHEGSKNTSTSKLKKSYAYRGSFNFFNLF